MKILLTSSKASVETDLDPRFGRAPYFVIFDLETSQWQAHPNTACEAAEGAGVHAAGLAIRLGAQAVVTGHCGPKAMAILQKAGVRIYSGYSGSFTPILEQIRRITAAP